MFNGTFGLFYCEAEKMGPWSRRSGEELIIGTFGVGAAAATMDASADAPVTADGRVFDDKGRLAEGLTLREYPI